jgi:hypothetical protein
MLPSLNLIFRKDDTARATSAPCLAFSIVCGPFRIPSSTPTRLHSKMANGRLDNETTE